MTKTVTTTREYDEEGRLIKETVSEVTTPDACVAPYMPLAAACTCGRTTVCPLHGMYRHPYMVTYCNPMTTTTAEALNLRDAISRSATRAEMKAHLS